MLLTFLDACVLIAAYRGKPPERDRAQALLSDPNRLFVSSPFLYLETVPMALYSRRQSEVEFYRVAAAHLAETDELVTLERESKPLYRSSLVRVVHLDAAK